MDLAGHPRGVYCCYFHYWRLHYVGASHESSLARGVVLSIASILGGDGRAGSRSLRSLGRTVPVHSVFSVLSWVQRVSDGFAHRPDSGGVGRSEEHTSELQSLRHLVCRLLLE